MFVKFTYLDHLIHRSCCPIQITAYALFGKHLSCAGSDVGPSPFPMWTLLGPVVSCVALSLSLQPNHLLKFEIIISYGLMLSSDLFSCKSMKPAITQTHLCKKR